MAVISYDYWQSHYGADPGAVGARLRAGDEAWLIEPLLDVTDREDMKAFAAQAVTEFGRLDVLLNVVGGTFRQPFEDSSPRGWDAVIRANFAWIVSFNSNARLNSGLNNDTRNIGIVTVKHRAHFSQNRRHSRAQGDAADFGCIGKKTLELQLNFVCGFASISLDAPRALEYIVIKQTKHRVGVAYVNGQQHR